MEDIKKRIEHFLDIRGADADYMLQLLQRNLREMRVVSRAALRHEDWEGAQRFASAVAALGENLEMARLKQAGQALQTCLANQDREKTGRVINKTNSILRQLEQAELSDDGKSSGQNNFLVGGA